MTRVTRRVLLRAALLLSVFSCALALATPALASPTVTWDGGGDGTTWNSAANWDTDTVPVAGDLVVIPNGTGPVTVDVSPAAITSLDYGDNTVTVPTGISANFGSLSGTGTVDAQSGSLLTWNTGTITGTGTVHVETGSDLQVDPGGGTLDIYDATLHVDGTLDLLGSGTVEDPSTAHLQIGAAGIVEYAGSAVFNMWINDVTASPGSPDITSNGGGTLVLGTTGSLSDLLLYRAYNASTIEIGCGTMSLTENTTVLTYGGGIVSTGSECGGATVMAATSVGTHTTIDGTLKLAGGTFNANAGAEFGGTGTLQFAGAALTATGGMTIDSGLTLRASDHSQTISNSTITNYGTTQIDDGAWLEDGGSTAFINEPGGLLVHDGAGEGDMYINDLQNQGGTVRAAGGGRFLFQNNASGATEVGGTWETQDAGSYIELGGGSRHWGDTTIAAGADVRLTNNCCTSEIQMQDGATLTVDGTLDQISAPIRWLGTSHLAGTGTLKLDGGWVGQGTESTSTWVIDSGATVVQAATVSFYESVDNHGTYEIDNGGAGDVLADDPSYSTTFHNESDGTLVGNATGAGQVQMGINGFYNEGTARSQSGTLRLTSELGGTNSGLFQADTGAQVEFAKGTWNPTSTTEFRGPGTLYFDASWGATSVDIANDVNITNGGTVRMQSGSTLTGTGHIKGGGTLEWSNGSLAGASGTITIDSGTTWKNSSDMIFGGSDGRTFVNNGTFEFAGNSFMDDQSSAGDLTFQNNGLLLHTGDGTTSCECFNLTTIDPSSTVRNTGTGTFKVGATVGTDNATAGTFRYQNGGGSYDAQGGRIELACGTGIFDDTTSITGSGVVALADTLSCNGTWDPMLDFTTSTGSPMTIDGTLELDANTITGTPVFDGGGTLVFAGGNLAAATDLETQGSLTTAFTSNTTLPTDATFTNGGMLVMSGGHTLATTQTLTNTATGDILNTDSTNAITGPVQNGNSITVLGGTLTLPGLANLNDVTHTLSGGSYQVSAGGVLALTALTAPITTLGATVSLGGTGAIVDGGATDALVASLATITPSGTLTLTNAPPLTGSGSLTSDGMLSLDHSSYDVQGAVDSAGYVQLNEATLDTTGLTQTAPGWVSMQGASTVSGNVQLDGGTFGGTGTVTGTVTQTGGELDPGGTSTTGTLDIQGGYTQTGGILGIDVADGPPVAADQLQVDGATQLDGITQVGFANYLTPTLGDAATVVSSLSGDSTLSIQPVDAFGVPISGEWWFDWTYANGTLDLGTNDHVAPAGPGNLASSSHVVGAPSNDLSIDLTWDAATDAGSGFAGYSTVLDQSAGTVGATSVDTAAGVTSATVTASAGTGDWYFHIRPVDAAGNWGTTQTFGPISIDTDPPDTSLTGGPSSGSFINLTSPTFTFTSTEAGGSFLCQDDGGLPYACTSGAAMAAAPLGDGPHSFAVAAVDQATNLDMSAASVSFTVDTTAPVVARTGGVDNATYTGATVQLDFSVTETNPGTLECSLDGGAFTACTTATSAHYTGLADGPHTITVHETDLATNLGSLAVSFTTDTTAPTLTNTTPAYDTDGNVNWTWTGTDGSGSGVASADCALDAGASAPCDTLGTFSAPGLADGLHTLHVVLTDVAGNATATQDLPVTVDTVNPAITLDSVSGNGYLDAPGHVFVRGGSDGSLTLHVTPTDATSGVASVTGPDMCNACGSDLWTPAGSASSVVAPYDLAYSWTAGTAWDTNQAVSVQDAAGRTGQDTFVVAADDTAPAGSSISYANARSTSSTVPVTFTVGTDGESGVAHWYIDRAACTDAAFASAVVVATDPGTSPHNDTLGSDGCYIYRLRVVDNVGNTETEVSAGGEQADRDTSAPVATIAASPASPSNTTGTVSLTGTLTEAGAIASASLDYAGPTSGNVCTTTNTGAYDGSCQWDVSGLADGDYTLTWTTQDDLGNTSNAVTLDYTIDRTAPALVLNATGVANASLPLAGTVSDAGTGLDTLTVTYTGPSSGTACTPVVAAGTWSCTWTTAGLAAGSYTLHVTATDLVGNTTVVTRLVTVRHDFTAPTLTLLTKSFTAKKVLKKVPLGTRFSEHATAQVTMTLPAKYVKKLGLGKKAIAMGSGRFTGGPGAVTLQISLTKAGKKAMSKLNKAKKGTKVVPTVLITLTDGASNRGRVTVTFVVKK